MFKSTLTLVVAGIVMKTHGVLIDAESNLDNEVPDAEPNLLPQIGANTES